MTAFHPLQTLERWQLSTHCGHMNEPQWAFGQTIDQSVGVESCRFLLQAILPVRLQTVPRQSTSVTNSSQSLHDKESVDPTNPPADPV